MDLTCPLFVVLCLSGLASPVEAVTACGSVDPATPSQVFNAQVIDLVLQVNSGTQVRVAGTGPMLGWQPTLSAIAFDPLCQRRGNLRWGENTVDVFPVDGTAAPSRFVFSIPASMNVQTQFQLYVAWIDTTRFKLLVLADGLLLAVVNPS